MSKLKADGTKKTLLRNTEVPIIKSVKSANKKSVSSASTKSRRDLSSNKFSSKAETTTAAESGIDLNLEIPEIEYINKKPSQSKESIKLSQTKSCNTVISSENVTKKLNVPHYKSLYKDLIPLESLDEPRKSKTRITPRLPVSLKEPEPKLEDYIEKKTRKDFIYQPTVKNLEHPKYHEVLGLRISGLLHQHMTEF